jgi:hypothetical protein
MRSKVAVDRIKHLIDVGADEEAIRELTELLDRDPAAGPLRTTLGILLNRTAPVQRRGTGASYDDRNGP